MKFLNGLVAFLIFAGVLCSCSNDSFNDKELLTIFLQDKDNGYSSYKSVNEVDFNVIYRPTDLLVEQELGENYTVRDIESLRKKYKNHIYFNISISKNNQEILSSLTNDRNSYGEMVNELAFGMEDKLNLITATRDTISMTDFIYPRLYGLSQTTTILIVYPREEILKGGASFKIVLKDMGLGTGDVGFRFKTNIIGNDPHLNKF